jgi:DNA-binding MarR family transcriptional regulator
MRRPRKLPPVTGHLTAFSHLLAQDQDASKLHMRDLQVIALLVANDTPMSVGQVAKQLTISTSHCSRVVDKLVLRKLLRRTDSMTDRRIAYLAPTPEARALDERVRAHFQAASEEALATA